MKLSLLFGSAVVGQILSTTTTAFSPTTFSGAALKTSSAVQLASSTSLRAALVNDTLLDPDAPTNEPSDSPRFSSGTATQAFNDLIAQEATQPQQVLVKNFTRSVFTQLDAPYRLHAVSAVVFTVGGAALVMEKFAHMMVSSSISNLHSIPYQVALATVGLSVVGSIVTGTLFLPKGSRFHHYREIFIATDFIMVADLMLWYWMSHGELMTRPELVSVSAPLVLLSVLMGMKGDLDFCITDDQGRMEFFNNGYITEEYSKPYWKYFTIIPTHLTTIALKGAGLAHVLVGGLDWLEARPHAAEFGSALYMSCLLLASWSSFMQGTLTFRQAPFLGKEKFTLGNDPTTWFINLIVFIPLLSTVGVGVYTGSLQEFFSF